jgi:hypothetical protein
MKSLDQNAMWMLAMRHHFPVAYKGYKIDKLDAAAREAIPWKTVVQAKFGLVHDFKQLLSTWEEAKASANDMFSQKNFNDAAEIYEETLTCVTSEDVDREYDYISSAYVRVYPSVLFMNVYAYACGFAFIRYDSILNTDLKIARYKLAATIAANVCAARLKIRSVEDFSAVSANCSCLLELLLSS